ncbi:hypothetical protein BTS2_3756 [Bacillus sp. TS-2]|nr:hypothetical protein BTS2_3756 [Bacillus sp. TS-2]
MGKFHQSKKRRDKEVRRTVHSSLTGDVVRKGNVKRVLASEPKMSAVKNCCGGNAE